MAKTMTSSKMGNDTTNDHRDAVRMVVSAAEVSAAYERSMRRVTMGLIGLAVGILLLIGVADAALAQSGQTHVIGERQVFCETAVADGGLTVTCSEGETVHLVIIQQGQQMVAYPQTKFGERINAVAYGYRVGRSAG